MFLIKKTHKFLVFKRYKPAVPKPEVRNLFNTDKAKLNEIVSSDLKQLKKKIIYTIDLVTRYTVAVFIENKEKICSQQTF